MKVFCRFRRRALERSAATLESFDSQSPLGRHLNRCPGCRTYFEDLRMLATALQANRQEQESNGFEDRVWSRIEARQKASVTASLLRQGVSLQAVLALGAAALLVVSVVGWIRFQPKGPTIMAGIPPDQKTVNAEKESTSKTSPVPNKKRMSTPIKLRLTHQPDQPVRHKRRRNPAPDFLRKPSRIALIAPHIRPISPARQWLSKGAWYEACGDYAQASSAYKQAFRYEPDPGIAFIAGRAAESADNVEDAVEFYANILSNHPSGPPAPEKGIIPWNEDLHVVLAVQSLFSPA